MLEARRRRRAPRRCPSRCTRGRPSRRRASRRPRPARACAWRSVSASALPTRPGRPFPEHADRVARPCPSGSRRRADSASARVTPASSIAFALAIVACPLAWVSSTGLFGATLAQAGRASGTPRPRRPAGGPTSPGASRGRGSTRPAWRASPRRPPSRRSRPSCAPSSARGSSLASPTPMKCACASMKAGIAKRPCQVDDLGLLADVGLDLGDRARRRRSCRRARRCASAVGFAGRRWRRGRWSGRGRPVRREVRSPPRRAGRAPPSGRAPMNGETWNA